MAKKGRRGDDLKTCVLYARVSSRSQAEEGYSVDGQLRELRAWALQEGMHILEEVTDKAFKRDTLARPGIDRIIDLCEERQVDTVIAWQRDRFGEYPYPDVLAGQLKRYGTTLRSLDDAGVGEDGELVNMFHDWMARRERRKTARRSRMGKLEMARSGYVVASHTPTYGFEYAGTRKERTYGISSERMALVRRIFYLVGVEGLGIRTVARILNQEGVPTPPLPNKKKNPEQGRYWSRPFIRDCIFNDSYKPHTPAELRELVVKGHLTAEVLARLDESKSYGVWWYRGKDYEGEEHRVAVPVCDSGIPREWIDDARAAIENNHPASTAGSRDFWELSHGLLFCSGCGRRMATHTVRSPRHNRAHHYYRCPKVGDASTGSCPAAVRLSARRVEEAVWKFVRGLYTNPEQLVASLDRRIEQERSRLLTDPDKEIRELQARREILAKRRYAYQEQQAAGYMTLEELGRKLEELEEGREAVESALEATRDRGEVIRTLERAREELAKGWPADKDVEELSDAMDKPLRVEHREDAPLRIRREKRTPQQRRETYQDLRLEVVARSKEELEVKGLFDPEYVYMSESSSGPGDP